MPAASPGPVAVPDPPADAIVSGSSTSPPSVLIPRRDVTSGSWPSSSPRRDTLAMEHPQFKKLQDSDHARLEGIVIDRHAKRLAEDSEDVPGVRDIHDRLRIPR